MGKYLPDINWNEFIVHDCSKLGIFARNNCYDSNAFAIIVWLFITAIISISIIRIIIHYKNAKREKNE